ncbi:MAG: hypothetical protein KBS95_04470 [Alistipes sp.]|nr:hypothetical protein [Candidatus Alistipes equi]
MKRILKNVILILLAVWISSCAGIHNIYTSKPYCLKLDDGKEYYIVIKQDKMRNNVYAEYVDAFAYRNKKKVVVSVYDGGNDLDDCGMEVQYKVRPNSTGKFKAPQHRIIYDEKKQILCIPMDSPERFSTWSNYYVVYKFDGKMFYRLNNKGESYFTWPFELPDES